MFKRITEDSCSSLSSATNSATSSNEDLTHESLDSLSSLSESSIETGDWEETSYKALIEEFPIGLWVWKLEEEKLLRLVFANATSEILRFSFNC